MARPERLLPDLGARGRLTHHPDARTAGAMAAGVALAVLIGGAIPYNPVFAAAGAVLVLPLLLLAMGPRLPGFALGAIGLILAGYAFFGRGFAYVGAPPVYIGDVVLMVALLAIAICLTHGRVHATATHGILALFILLGALRTIPYIERDGINALRDGALWGYAFFAFAVSFIVREHHIDRLVRSYGKAIPLFLVWVPIAAAIDIGASGSVPRWPGSGVPVFVWKGDMGVHLAGVAAFVLLGLHAARRKSPLADALVWPLWFAAAALTAAINRGAFVAMLLAVGVAFFLRSSTGRIRFLGVAAMFFAVAALIDPAIDIGSKQKVSLKQLGLNALSVVDKTGESHLEGSKEFRLEWWKTIWGYTVEGPYRWTGKGFGINLADDDGFQVGHGGKLRAPHNSHVTVLARMGVPGLALWIVLQAAFGFALARSFLRARRLGLERWRAIIGWVLVYWIAMMVDTSFDPYLEGPQGGIWFWSVVGFGLAAMRMQRSAEAELATRRQEAA